MLRSRLNLECDECGDPYPRIGNLPSPVDGAIYTAGQLRSMAKKNGWMRLNAHFGASDFCPRCAKKFAKKGSR